MTIIELRPASSEAVAEDTEPLPKEGVLPGISEDFGAHQEAIYNSGAVAVLAASSGWEKFVLAGSYDVKRTMRVGDREVTLRQYMALWCVGVAAGDIRERLLFIDDTYTAGLEEHQLAAIGLPAMERRHREGYHSGTFNQLPLNALQALMYHAYEVPPVPAVAGAVIQAA